MMVFRSVAMLIITLLVVLSSGCTSEEEKTISKGKEIYTSTCKVCHAQGINGAPILGNKKMWAKRAEQGLPVLVQHATNGFGLMPAKGGNDALSEHEISSAIQYMLSRLNKE